LQSVVRYNRLTGVLRRRIIGGSDGRRMIGFKMTHASWRRFAIAALVLAESGIAGSAAADVCTDLQTRLDALDRTNASNSSTYNTYDAQVTQQRAAVDQATNSARAAGCYGGFFAPKPSPKCPQMLSSLNAMQTNLAKLTAARDQYRSDPYTLTSQRNDVVRLLQLNRCGNYANAAPPSNGGFFASLFGGGGLFTPFGNGYYSGNPYAYGATYRTLCVRSCDGYYFPISYATTPDRFATDAQTCTAMCPGAEASLYVYHNPGEEVDAMVSLTGTPYTALPNAFKYRTSYDPSCSCGSSAPSLMDQLTAQAAALTPGGVPGATPLSPVNIPSANATFTPFPVANGPIVPVPHGRPLASEDPETLADRAGDLVPAPISNGSKDQRTAGVTADGRPIRIVGPDYYVAQ
jgi:Protein of unknown function (DUF2865)